MNIFVKKELSTDLIQNVNWPLFSARPDLKNRGLLVSAYTLTWRSSDKDTGAFLSAAFKDLELRFVRVAEALDRALQVFVPHSTMQPRSAMVLYRKIWKTLSMGSVPGGVEVGFEHLIECVPGVRFATLANVPMVAVPWMISTIQRFDVVVPLLLQIPVNIQDSSALELARIALPPDGCSVHSQFDWAGFACHVAMLGGVCLREGGAAAGEFAVDFFTSEANMPALARSLGSDDGLGMYQVQ